MENEIVDRTITVKSALFYKLLYILLFTFVNVIDKLYDVIYFNYKKLWYIIRMIGDKSARNSFECVQKLKKIPNHLTVLLGEEEPSYKDLANIVIWSTLTGIPFVSFYDFKGELQKDELRKAVIKLRKEEDCVIWHDFSNKNGFVGRKVHIKVYSPNDGKLSVVRVAEEFINTTEDINIQLVDSVMRKHFEFPDPDLALYCGKKCITWGYPPWQLRLTEFFSLGRLSCLTPDTFIDILVAFSKCEQRLGK